MEFLLLVFIFFFVVLFFSFAFRNKQDQKEISKRKRILDDMENDL